jgi:4-amino-4-deoxy-L-arabinose transferase-like glycosyltransferase
MSQPEAPKSRPRPEEPLPEAEPKAAVNSDEPSPEPSAEVSRASEQDDADATAGAPSAADEAAGDAAAAAEKAEEGETSEKSVQPEKSGKSDKDDAKESSSMLGFMKGGHPMRWLRGGATFGVGAFGAILLMARTEQWRWGVPVGLLFVLTAVVGLLDFVGSFDDATPWIQGVRPKSVKNGTSVSTLPPARVGPRVDASSAYMPAFGALVAALLSMTLMAHAIGAFWGVFIAGGWITTAVFGFQALAALGLVDDAARPLLSRHGFWLIVFCCVLFFPTLGAHSLVDPWETHYGEVSREILSRDDWITIWWAEEGWFVSKPILDFWMQALAMAAFGVGFVGGDKHAYMPGNIIAPAQIGGEPTHPEWIVRFPSLILSVIALYLAYRAVAQVRGRRAGLISSIVLATGCDWAMLSHQSITDMPFVASLTAAMSLLIIGLTTDDDATVRAVPVRFGSKIFSISGYHLALGVVLVCALPQALYLISRNFEFVTSNGFGFAPHLDEYFPGSGHECWKPQDGSYERLMVIGKWPCDKAKVFHPEFQPVVQGLAWLGLGGLLVALNRNERRISRLCFMVAWVFASISTMGKGVAGFLLPIAVAGIYVVTARKWRDLLRFEFVSGAIILGIVAAPWFVGMFMRMGDEFIQQLFVHHMWKRALDHVHDTNGGDDVSLRYYVWQLGYAFFPWSGVVAGGLVWWARDRWGVAKRALSLADERRRDVGIFLVMWFVFAWALFTYMKTKFHHYVFPAVPPAAMLTGIFLDEALGTKRFAGKTRVLLSFIGATLGVGVAAYGFSRLVPGTFFGSIEPKNALPPAAPVVGALLAASGLVIAFVSARFGDDPGAPDDDGRTDADGDAASSTGIFTGALAIAGAVATALVTRDLASMPLTDIKGQERLIQLFTYRYDRVWPKELAFSAPLLGFGLAATALVLMIAVRAYRRQAIVSLAALAFLWAGWDLNVYMVKVAPHWGQRPLFEAYYRDRRSVNEPVVAFEMNWKGENFYSGGRLVEFGNGMAQGATAGERASDRMRTWLTDMRKHVKAVYFVTEFGRVQKIEEMLRSTMGTPPNGATKWAEQITTEAQCNKFVVVRARFE